MGTATLGNKGTQTSLMAEVRPPTKNKRGAGSQTGNRDRYASLMYRETLSRWTQRMQSITSFNLSDTSLGEYITKFIEYFETTTGSTFQCREGRKNGYAGRWKAAVVTSSFQKLEEDSLAIKFIEFCVTGSINSNFSATAYLDTGNESLLSKNAWQYKKIPLMLDRRDQEISPRGEMVQVLERLVKVEKEVVKLNKKIAEMELKGLSSDIKTSSFSSLLNDWTASEAQRLQLTTEIVLTDLCNKLGFGASLFELKDIIYGTHPIDKNKFRHYAQWISALNILKKSDGDSYTAKELLAIPSGIPLS